jgi:hypothetical protein
MYYVFYVAIIQFIEIKIAWKQLACNQVSTPLSLASCSTPHHTAFRRLILEIEPKNMG